MSLEWLNGWQRSGNSVLIDASVHCLGCGRYYGITCVAYSDDWERPEELPEWPFPQDDCPICQLPPHDANYLASKYTIGTLARAIRIKKRKVNKV